MTFYFLNEQLSDLVAAGNFIIKLKVNAYAYSTVLIIFDRISLVLCPNDTNYPLVLTVPTYTKLVPLTDGSK